VEALRGVSFEVTAGEVFGLLGANGAGKTTTLECILGLRRPDSGSVDVDGIGLGEHPRQVRQMIGAQIQGATLQDKITPKRALELFAGFYRDPAPVEGLIVQFGLGEKQDAPFATLSAGQQQRLFLAMALVNNPRLVVLDEPTSGLDPRARRELHALIASMKSHGRTVLLSTHDLDEASGLCDRIGIIDRGAIVAVGTPAALVTRAGSLGSIHFRTASPIQAPELAGLSAVEGFRKDGEVWTLRSAKPEETVLGLAGFLERSGNQLLDLKVVRPSLEDAFLKITGRPWSQSGGPE